MTKQAMITELLSRETGASIPDIMTVAGWKENTVRGFLSSQKKAGANILSRKDHGIRAYYIAAAPALAGAA